MAASQTPPSPASSGRDGGGFKRLARQTWTLMCKNWRSLLLRHMLIIAVMALLLPLLLSAFFSFAKNLFVPPATYGIGSSRPVLTLPKAFDAAQYSGRDKLVLVSGGHGPGGSISRVLDDIARQAADYGPGMRVVRLDAEDGLVSECRSTLRGVTACFAAVVMRSSPTEGSGPGRIWNYTIRADASLARSPLTINIDSPTNPEQVYLMPLQRAVDSAIARLEGRDVAPLGRTNELPFTSRTQEERDRNVRNAYHSAIVNFMGVAFISTVLWITYHLTGLIATERESGISQLIDAMMPVSHPWEAQAARIIAHHLSFSAVYAPAWFFGSIIIRFGVFVNTSAAIVIFHHLFAGLSLASFSILVASFFNKAQLSSITTILATLLLAILAQSITAPNTATVAVLSVLFAPCNYVYFITLLARFEKQDRPANLAEMPPDSPWEIPGIVLWVLMVAQIFVYPLLAAFVERWLYGTSTKGRHMQMKEGKARSSLAENAVELDRLTKIYYPSLLSRVGSLVKRSDEGAEPVAAVKELSLNVPRGQIVTLLGANGSGKSTTLDAIAGLHRLTSGSITIDGTGGLGIAPQKNVLWDDLTVEEHLIIFNRLKSPGNPAPKEEIAELIKSIDLHPKRKSFAKTLSGGQKRKLQLGMMLTGGSSVCCVDEVSSGLDPLSRRKIWDILLAERGRRTLILTTHFLDEADLLADHIAILSKGTLRAAGSSVELKDRLGGGYRVHVHKEPGITRTPDIEGVQKKEALDVTTYVSPTSSLAAEVVRRLDGAGITDYRFSSPTIEDVFLRLAEEIKDEQVLQSADNGALVPEEGRGDDSSRTSGEQQNLKLMDGTRIGYVKQAVILLRKRFTVLKRNWIPYVVAFCLPIFAAALTSLYVRNEDPMGCSAAQQSSASGTQDAFSQMRDGDGMVFLAGPRSRFDASSLNRLLAPVFAGSSGGAAGGPVAISNMRIVDTFDDFKRFITDNRRNLMTGLWLGDDQSPPTVGWVANLFVTSSLTAQQFLDVLVTNTSIATSWSPFDVPFNPGIGSALNLVVYMGIALACYPALFGLYPSNERRRFVRALQYSNGVRPLPLWGAYLALDFTIALVATAVAVGLWAALSNVWYHLGYVFVVFFLYGLASTILAYFVSLFAGTQLASFAWAAAYQGVLFLAYLIAYVCIITYVNVNKIDSSIIICHFIISVFAPIGSAMRALFISTNLFSTACDGQRISDRPGSFAMYGGPIAYLVIQCLVLFGLLIWFDSGAASSSIRELVHGRKGAPPGDGEGQDEEMAQEVTRVASGGTNEDGLRVMHLTKSFGKNTAVDNVTFGIKRGEVFALLGPNGAGKSTTISLIRGDMKPSGANGGDVLVEDKSVTKTLAAARMHLGVCPQIDALDQMTVQEHLEFYARVRGVPDVEHNVSVVLRAVGLDAFSTRMANALSGGNKRKLSLGIALMGNPTVVLLDEPSSGLDAAAKRIMWRTLKGALPGRSILLTTHSMEEADALAGRAGILARRMLAMGTPDHLRHRFGDALHVHLVASTAPRTSDEDMDRIASFVRATFPSAKLDAKTYHGQMRFSVEAADVVAASERSDAEQTAAAAREPPPASHSLDIQAADRPAPAATGRSGAIGRLVVLLEEHKARLGVEHYSVSPTTLDQVFLAIVGRHNVSEENYDEPKKRGAWSRAWNLGRS